MEVMTAERLKYLNLLAEQFHSEQELCTEIINLSGILSLPKGTEHFMSDIHGEYESFCHIMNNCSGVIREKVTLWLGDNMTGAEVSELCTLIYYPREKLKLLEDEKKVTPEWYQMQMGRLVYLARMLSSKYTRSRVRKAMPEAYAGILDELLHAQTDEDDNRHQYHQSILDTLIAIGSGDDFIIVLADLIKYLAVDRLHVVGDIFDRGARADSIMDILMRHHSIDIEWGNHDILWMGAAAGSEACVAGVVRNCLQYRNMEILENSYGIPLRPLALFAEKLYPEMETDQAALEAITIMMFKLEGQLIRRNPDFGMESRLLLDKIDLDSGTVCIDDTTWPLLPRRLPTLNKEDPYALTDEEQQVISGLRDSFRQSLRLRSHISFLYTRGRLYRRYNGNLLFHGCVPMNEDGPDMDLIEQLVANDASVKGIWCVPKYSNPQGYSYSDETVRRFAALKPAAEDFRIFWDNAYCVHHLYEDKQDTLLDILSECEKAGNPDMVYEFASTSKVTFAGDGISAIATSEKNLKDIKAQLTVQTIGHDKVNMLRHVRFLKDADGICTQMKKQAALLRPKFELVDEVFTKELSGLGVGSWTKPNGGYFIAYETMEGCAKETVRLAKECGVTLTGAGAPFPYGKDPLDNIIRIAPSFPEEDELRAAAEIFTICVRLAAVEKLL